MGGPLKRGDHTPSPLAFSSPGSRKVVRGNRRQWRYREVMRAACRRLVGRDAERFGMGPAVVLGQDLTEAAGPVRHGALADLAAGDRQLANGHGEAAGR
jgi:hypothetical protein